MNYLLHVEDPVEEWVFYYNGKLTRRFSKAPNLESAKDVSQVERLLGVRFEGPIVPYETLEWEGVVPKHYPIPDQGPVGQPKVSNGKRNSQSKQDA